jgi:beta-glucosidase
VTILQGIRNRAGSDTEVGFARGVVPPESGLRSEPIQKEYLNPAGNRDGNGLKAEYFDNPDLEGAPVLVRTDPGIQMFWRLEGPGAGVPSDSFSVRWTGTVTPPVSGNYEIGLFTDEKGRLYIDDELVVDNWEPYGMNFSGSDTVSLLKERDYRIRVEYADISGFAGTRLAWKKLDEPGENEAMMAEAVELAGNSDVVIAVAGISPRLEGEEMRIRLDGFEGGDRTRLSLPEPMQALIRRLHATGNPVILVLTSGSALAVNWEKEHLPAILQAWYPGQQGGNAVADVLFGNYSPAGRLPVIFYKSVDDTVTVAVTLSNSGDYDGDEAVQLYVRDPESPLPQPLKSLKGFKRVFMARGETRTIEIPLAIKELGCYSEVQHGFVVEPGIFEIQAGASSADIRLQTRITVR